MDTENLLQINNFASGMNTDTSDSVLKEDAYRLANNLRYITNTQENSGELHLIEGAQKIAQIQGKIIASTNLRDMAIFVVEGGNGWQVYTLKDQLKLVANIHAKDDRVIGKKLSLVTRYENNTNQKLYIADGAGPVISIQLYLEDDQLPPTTLHDVESVPSIKFSKPVFCGLIDGNINAAVVEYSYQFYKKYGQQSEISPSTKLIPLFSGGTTAKQSNKILGYLSNKQTDKGVKIKINVGEITPFDSIRIFRISYVEVGQLPTIECVYDEKIASNYGAFIFEDTGLPSLSVYSLEEYNSMTGMNVIPKVIESKDDYLFAANIKNYNSGFDIKNWKAEDNVTLSLVTVDLIGDNTIDPNNPVQKSNDISLGQTIQTSDGQFDLSDYIDTTGVDDVLSYCNPQVSYMFRSLRRGEKYRFGIVLYDEKGRSSGVCHIKDLDIDIAGDVFEIQNGRLIVKPVGIKFNIQSLPEGTEAYEIVRCGRSVFDTETVAQGVLSRPIAREYTDRSHVKESHPLTPTGLVTIHDAAYFVDDDDENIHWSCSTNKKFNYYTVDYEGDYTTYQFISPEYSYLSDTLKDTLQNVQLQVCPIKFICPYAFKEQNFQNDCTYTVSIEDTSVTVTGIPYINYGNKYANISVTNPISQYYGFGFIHEWYDTILTDYVGKTSERVSFENEEDFKERFYDTDKRFAYSKLYYTRPAGCENKQYNINSIGFPDTLNWDDFASPQAENFQLIYTDKVCAVGGKNFVNWVCGGVYGRTDKTTIPIPVGDLDDGSCKHITSMGPGGKCLLISVDSDEIAKSCPQSAYIGTYICNIKKSHVLDSSTTAKKNAIYRSFGDYFNKDTKSGFIFDGDCFVQVFEYVAQHKFAHASSPYYRTACKIFAFPLETSVNLAYTSGYEFNKEYSSSTGDITYIQNDASNVNGLFIQDKPLYVYNSAYSSIDTTRSYASQLLMDEDGYGLQTDCRVFYSNIKSNNETVDSWLKYQPANFIDVDTRKGPITGLRTFKNQLIFWQEYATGLLSVNERSMITDDSNLPLILGTGGVLQRFDYITNTNGMHINDYSDTQSNTTLYWWDRINKSICGYSGGQDAIELSKIKFVQNYLNKNTPTDNPVLAYDNKTKEVVAKVVDGNDSVKESGSIIYNEHVGQFISLYTIDPHTKVELPEGLLFTNNNNIYKWNILKDNGQFAYGFDEEPLLPYIKHVVNHNGVYTKVFDNAEFAGRVYGGDDLSPLKLTFSTPLKQRGSLPGSQIQNREYNFKYIIPRNEENGEQPLYGGRLRGKTMQCELESSSNSYDFSLQYIKTKFRISWS